VRVLLAQTADRPAVRRWPPELAPLFAGGGNMLGTWTFGCMGGIVCNTVCC
jgi:hypothetical protein